MRIKAVLFDIDNTLFDTTKFAEMARRNAISAMREAGLSVDEEKAYRTLVKIVEKQGSNYGRHFNLLLQELGVREDPKIIAAGVIAYHNTKAALLPFPDVPKTLMHLRDFGYKIYVATEGNSVKQWDKLIRMGLGFMFHRVFVSEELGVKKSREFYRKILGELKIKPVEAVMIGDRCETDIEPAKALGMHAIRSTRHGDDMLWSKAEYQIKSMSALIPILKKIEKKK